MGQKRAVVVTGAAQGIGLAVAHRFAADGARVALLDVNQEGLQKAAASLKNDVGHPFPCDVTDPEQLANVAEQVSNLLGVPEVVVANVGWTVDKRFLESDAAEDRRLVDLNYTGALNTTRAFAPGMVQEKRGRIIYISSDAARIGIPGQAVYAGAKAAVIGYAKSMAVEFARYSITVNVVCPGSTDTALFREAMTAEQVAQRVKANPMRRIGDPEDIAHAVNFFASRDSGFITGQVLSVNGGMLRVG